VAAERGHVHVLPLAALVVAAAILGDSTGYLIGSAAPRSGSALPRDPRQAGYPALMLLVGTSGWMYDDWRDRFYPRAVPKRAWLAHYAERFATVEINNAFYRLPERDTFAGWRDGVPRDFRYAVKISRYLSHIKRLKDPAEPVARFFERASALGDRLGPVLLQLPPTLRADAGLLAAALDETPAGTRVAVEPRNESWWTREVATVLEAHDAALVWADRLGRPVTPEWTTATWGYVRFHEGRARPRPSYGESSLRTWLRRIEHGFGPLDSNDVYAYFNNDPGAAAIRNAAMLADLAEREGVALSRHPNEVPVVHSGPAGPA